MTIVTAILGNLSDVAWNGAIDPLELTAEERASAHLAMDTQAGRHVRLSLPRGSELQDGDILFRDADVAVVVKAKSEALFRIRPGADQVVWWAACYQLGNFHRPARFNPDGILTPADPTAAQMLQRLSVTIERIYAPFVGLRFGAAGAHHASHDHGHSHHHGSSVHSADHDHETTL